MGHYFVLYYRMLSYFAHSINILNIGFRGAHLKRYTPSYPVSNHILRSSSLEAILKKQGLCTVCAAVYLRSV